MNPTKAQSALLVKALASVSVAQREGVEPHVTVALLALGAVLSEQFGTMGTGVVARLMPGLGNVDNAKLHAFLTSVETEVRTHGVELVVEAAHAAGVDVGEATGVKA